MNGFLRVCVYIYNIGIGISSKTQLFFHGKPQSCIFVNSLGTSTAFTRSQNPLRNPTEMLWICPSWVFSFGKARSLDVPKPFRCSDLAGNSSTVKSCFPDEPWQISSNIPIPSNSTGGWMAIVKTGLSESPIGQLGYSNSPQPIEVFLKWGYPQIIYLNGFVHYKPTILGSPMEPPN